jgi:hypothetical protein
MGRHAGPLVLKWTSFAPPVNAHARRSRLRRGGAGGALDYTGFTGNRGERLGQAAALLAVMAATDSADAAGALAAPGLQAMIISSEATSTRLRPCSLAK